MTRGNRSGGNALMVVLLVLLVIGGGLGFNYYRNLQADLQEEGARPYAHLATKDLAVLRGGYESELAAARARIERAGPQRIRTRDRGFFGDQVKEFERVQVAASKVRDKQIEVAQLQSTIDDIKAEEARRAVSPMQQHLNRLFRF